MLEPLIPSPVDVIQDALDRAQRVGRHWVWADGTVRPVIAGGSGGQGAAGDAGGDAVVDPPAGDPPKPADPPKPPEAKLTQADIDRAKADAKKAAIAEVAQTLGCTIEEAKALVEAKRATDDAQKTEAQKKIEAAEERERKADERERQAAAKERATDVKAALLAAKVTDKRLDKAGRLILADLAEDADEAAIAAAVETFKKDTPEWFGTVAGAPGSDPGGRGPGGGGGNDGKTGMDAGRQRAIDRKANQPADAADPLGAFAKIG